MEHILLYSSICIEDIKMMFYLGSGTGKIQAWAAGCGSGWRSGCSSCAPLSPSWGWTRWPAARARGRPGLQTSLYPLQPGSRSSPAQRRTQGEIHQGRCTLKKVPIHLKFKFFLIQPSATVNTFIDRNRFFFGEEIPASVGFQFCTANSHFSHPYMPRKHSPLWQTKWEHIVPAVKEKTLNGCW